MSWFASKRAARFLLGAAIYALAWWLTLGAVIAYHPSLQRTSRFTIVRFHADYQLSVSNDGGARMDVTETIVVDFPAGNGIHGIIRELPATSGGRNLGLLPWVSAYRDGEREFPQVESNSTTQRVRIGSTSAILSGRHSYQLMYSYSDVVRNRGGNPSLYWNINGTGWPQAMESVTASITFDQQLAKSLDGTAACFFGDRGSTDPCTMERTDNSDGSVTLRSGDVAVDPYQTQTVKIGLAKGSVNGPGLAVSTWVWLGLVWFVVGLLAYSAILNLRRAAARRWRPMGSDPIEVQFASRSDLPPILAAALVGFPGRGLVAELLRAARERHVTLSGGGDTDTPLTAELVSWPKNWSKASRQALKAVFGSEEPGATVNVAHAIAALPAEKVIELRDLAPDHDLVSADQRSGAVRSSMNWLLVAAAVLTPALIISGRRLNLPFWWVVIPAVVLVVSLAVSYGLVLRWQELTDKGHDAMRYLEGLKKFLTTSEAERMRAVQGERTSPRYGPEQRISIFEKLLPYAVALGVEESWQRAVGTDLEVGFEWLPPAGVSGTGWGLANSWAYDTSPAGLAFGSGGAITVGESLTSAMGPGSWGGGGGGSGDSWGGYSGDGGFSGGGDGGGGGDGW